MEKLVSVLWIFYIRRVIDMSLEKLILNICLKIVAFFSFFVKQDPNRITFVSLTQDCLSSDFELIDAALKKENKYHIYYNLIVYEKNLKGTFTYFLNCLKQYVDLKKSKLVIINDNNYVISTIKPKDTHVLQVWHACGAVKKFGNEIQRKYPIQNYDAILCNAPYWQDIYARSFHVQPNQVYVTGMPRIDTLLDEALQKKNKEEFLKRYPQIRNKKVILYAPTFRGNLMDGLQINSFDFKKVEEQLNSDYVILYKFHPLLGDVQIQSNAINVNKEDLYTLFTVSDCLISDYSSIVFDYSLLDKKTIIYSNDLEEYTEDIGLNIHLNEEFNYVCTNEDQLVQAILDTKPSYKLDFQKKYMVYTDGKNTSRVIDLIDELMK